MMGHWSKKDIAGDDHPHPVHHPAHSQVLFFVRGRASALAKEIPCAVNNGVLRLIARAGWGLRKLFLLPAWVWLGMLPAVLLYPIQRSIGFATLAWNGSVTFFPVPAE